MAGKGKVSHMMPSTPLSPIQRLGPAAVRTPLSDYPCPQFTSYGSVSQKLLFGMQLGCSGGQNGIDTRMKLARTLRSTPKADCVV